jgi:hypothetical protein
MIRKSGNRFSEKIMPRQIPLIDYQARRVESESVTGGKSAKVSAAKIVKEKS